MTKHFGVEPLLPLETTGSQNMSDGQWTAISIAIIIAFGVLVLILR